VITYRYRIYPDEADALIQQQLIRGHRFGRAITEIQQKRKEARWDHIPADRAHAIELKQLADARQHSGLRWPTYNTITSERSQASKTSSRKCLIAKKDGTCSCGANHVAGDRIWMQFEPRVRVVGCPTCGRGLRMPRDDGGVIGGQLVASKDRDTTNDILSGSSKNCQISGEGRNRTIRLLITVGTKNKAAEWISAPMVYHRDLPPNVQVAEVKFSRRRVGHRYLWHVLMSLYCESVPLPSPTQGEVGVDLGWREMDDGSLRVAFWRDDKKREGEIRLPADLVARFRSVDNLKSTRDLNRDKMQSELLDIRRRSGSEWPEWLRRATEHMHVWKSPDRYARLLRSWSHRVSPSDAKAYSVLAQWYRSPQPDGTATGDAHLAEWETHQREKCLRQRQEIYRLAARTFGAYGTVKIEDLSLSELAKVPDDPAYRLARRARANRVIAAPSYLFGDIKSAVKRSGGLLIEVDPAYTSQDCPDCGRRSDFGSVLVHVCPQCGEKWDRDAKGAENIRRRAARCCTDTGPRSQPETLENTGGGAWQRRKSAKKSRETHGCSQDTTQDVDVTELSQ
jgi:hypothetical protein